ncbi:MAG TPA: hypothetical protein VLW85_26005 [Myxococcales bacterium]|nr:hypothetical protein [Myxococcales bacterium]
MLWLPGIVFLGLVFWVVQKLVIAARNEDVLREQRLAAFVGEPQPAKLQPLPAPPPPKPLDRADVAQAAPEHLPLVESAVVGRRVEVLWVRSNSTHVAWCERRFAIAPAARPRDVICVAQVVNGAVGERWSFG